MRIELKRLQRSLGVTMLFVTHDQEEALSMSDKVVVMQGGRIQQVASPREMYERPANSFVASFLGTANFFTGKVEALRPGGTATIRLASGASTEARVMNGVAAGQDVKLVVRPEWLSIAKQGSTNALAGEVRELIYQGASVRYGIALDGRPDELVVVHELSSGEALAPGERISLDVRAAAVVD